MKKFLAFWTRPGFASICTLYLTHEHFEEKRVGVLMTPRYIEWLAKRDAAEPAQ